MSAAGMMGGSAVAAVAGLAVGFILLRKPELPEPMDTADEVEGVQ